MRTFVILAGCLLISLFANAQITVTTVSDTVGVNNVYELTIANSGIYKNNWEDVTIQAAFTNSKTIEISGFFYDAGVWKVRFAPPETGVWNYTINFKTSNTSYSATGKFLCVASNRKGFLKLHPNNPFRLIFPDGSAFNGLGVEDCMVDYNNNKTPLDNWGFDGEHRTPTYIGSLTDLNTYLNAYGDKGAGFNLFRWSTDNCSFRLYDSLSTKGNAYYINEGKFGDTLVRKLSESKMRIWLTFFNRPVFSNITKDNPEQEAAIKRYINYVMARYGAYTDIWELFNEASASDYYYKVIPAYIKSIDPYKRLISVSDERPQLESIDINSPHWYEKESELKSDARAWEMITSRKKFNKPIIFGEQGNSVQNWDPLSAERMRLRTWTSFFAEGILILWNTSFAKDFPQDVAANIYLGPIERGYIRSLHDFSNRADSSARPFVISPLNHTEVRSYGLSCTNTIFGYFHHYNNHDGNVNTSFKYRMRKPGTLYWIDPSTNKIIDSAKLDYGTQIINSPPFKIDLAMRIDLSSSNAPFNELAELDLIVYPNPANTAILLNGNFNDPVTVKLYNVNGQKLLEKKNVLNDERIDISLLPVGMYIYLITSAGRQKTGKLVVFR